MVNYNIGHVADSTTEDSVAKDTPQLTMESLREVPREPLMHRLLELEAELRHMKYMTPLQRAASQVDWGPARLTQHRFLADNNMSTFIIKLPTDKAASLRRFFDFYDRTNHDQLRTW